MQHYTILIIDDKREQAKEIKKKIGSPASRLFMLISPMTQAMHCAGTYDAYLSDLMMPVHPV